jgi:tryptophanyl-tRNA synthetase
VQHIEMARDFAQRFNHLYGTPGGEPHFVLPEAAIEEQVATLPGLDGRKMSKSYDNVIPLFAPRDQLRRLILSIVTDSRAPGEPKETQGSALFEIYRAFASADETSAMRQAYADGIGWGDAKQQLFERIDAEVAPMRERYDALMAHPERIEALLRDGASRLRESHAIPFMRRLRAAVGLRDLGAGAGVQARDARAATGANASKATLPAFKQYREADGRFHFKLVDGERLLLISRGFESPKDAGARIAALRRDGFAGADADAALGEGVDAAEVRVALEALRAADEAKA